MRHLHLRRTFVDCNRSRKSNHRCYPPHLLLRQIGARRRLSEHLHRQTQYPTLVLTLPSQLRRLHRVM